MKKLSDALKRMLTGLAYQDAGEFLTTHQKWQTLNSGRRAEKPSPSVQPAVARRPSARRVALISDGRNADGAFDFALQACHRQGAQLELFLHGPVRATDIAALVRRVQREGLVCRRIVLSGNPANAILAHMEKQLSLLYLVASPDDAAARELVEKLALARGKRHLAVPLVLIEDRPKERLAAACAL